MSERTHATGLFLIEKTQRIEVLDLTGESDRKLFSIELFDVVSAAHAIHQGAPRRWNIVSDGRHQTESCYNYSTPHIFVRRLSIAVRSEKAARNNHRRTTINELPLVLLDVSVSVANALDLLGIFVRDLDVELLFKTHHQFDQIERIGTEVLNKPSVLGDLGLVYTEFINDDLFDLILNF